MICCGKEMIHNQLGYYTCDVCKKQYYDEIETIEQALKDHPGANAIELVKYTGLSSKVILDYMRYGNVVPIKKEKNMKGYYMGENNKAKWHTDFYRRKK